MPLKRLETQGSIDAELKGEVRGVLGPAEP